MGQGVVTAIVDANGDLKLIVWHGGFPNAPLTRMSDSGVAAVDVSLLAIIGLSNFLSRFVTAVAHTNGDLRLYSLAGA